MTSGDGSPEKEYDQIEQDRRAWAEANASRDRLFLPLAIGVFAFLGSQMPQFIRLGIEQFALITGGLLLLVLLGSWRWVVHYTDMHIVRLYRDEVALEKKLGLNIRSKYVYANLAGRSGRLLAIRIGTDPEELKRWSYEEFAKHVSGLTPPQSPYDDLVEVLKRFGYWSVSTRGHFIWDLAALSLCVLWFVMAFILLYGIGQVTRWHVTG